MPNLEIISRADWGAIPAQKHIEDLPKPVMRILLTKTRTLPCDNDEECKEHMRKMQAFHMGKGMEDIAYNFIITPDAKVYEGRGWYKVAPTPKERPEFHCKALVIGMLGDYPAEHQNQVAMFDKGMELAEKITEGKQWDKGYEMHLLPCWIDYIDFYLHINGRIRENTDT